MQGARVGEAWEPVGGVRAVAAHDTGCSPEERQALGGLLQVHQGVSQAAQEAHMLQRQLHRRRS